MRVKKRDTVRIVSLLLCLSLIFPFGLPPAVSAEADNDALTSMRESVKPADKLSDSLQKQFKDKESVTFLLKFKEQVDTQKVAAETEKKAHNQKKTAAQTELRKRSAVLNALRVNALETQHDVRVFLDKQKKEGQVKDYHSFYIVNAIAVTATKEVAEQLAVFSEVEKILPNVERQLIPANSAGMNAKMSKGANTDQPLKSNDAKKGKTDGETSEVEWNVAQINAPDVWDMGIDGSGTVVANIDTGVEWDHPALKEQYRGFDPANPDEAEHEFNFYDATVNEADGLKSEPYDDNGRGTHIMGTAIGGEPDGTNQIGVAPGAHWIAVKAFIFNGSTSDIQLLKAGEWILAPKDTKGNPHPEMAPDVVNNSWAGGEPGVDPWFRIMVQNWRAAEILPVFSAGDTGSGTPGEPGSIPAPANYPESFAVGATDIDNKLADFSHRGPSPYEEVKPDVSAPGVNIRSSVPGGHYEGEWDSTSMAAPHLTGTAALLLQTDASLTVDELEDILKETASPLTDEEYTQSPNNGYGYGLIDAFNAVSMVTSGLGRVKGHVVREGEDKEPPTFQHEAPDETHALSTLRLNVAVQDNISIRKVDLQYRSSEEDNWQTVSAWKTQGDQRDAVYTAAIPGSAIIVPSVTYRWHVTDYGNNEVWSDPYEVDVVVDGVTIGYFMDFESPPVGWSWDRGWDIGVPTSGPGEAYSGENVFATNLDGPYDNDTDAQLRMPNIYVPEGETYLQFKHWYEFEEAHDYGRVLISTDRKNWQPVAQFTGESNGWLDGEVSLTDYEHQYVYIIFQVTSNSSIQKQGWYLDDIGISDTSLDESMKVSLGINLLRVDETEINQERNLFTWGATRKVKGSNIFSGVPGKRDSIEHNNSRAEPQSLPLHATVSVLEADDYVHTDPADGSYSLHLPEGAYTLQAEAYGYDSVTRPVDITADDTVDVNFVLEPAAQGTVTGTVTNEVTGEPLEGATILLMEDAAIQPVRTNKNGEYSLSAYEGTYTLKVLAPNFYSRQTEITITADERLEQDIKLKPFVGYPGEIAYDDGTGENARAFNETGNAFAVKMSLEAGQERAMITAGVFRFWNSEWPYPGGEDIQVAIYDASGTDGAPGKKLVGPIDATALRTGEWTVVDVSQEGVVVDGDFYMVYIQADSFPNTPGLAIDEDGLDAGRSWQLVDGVWSKVPERNGNYMIRARVNYEVTVPIITSPEDGTYTNEAMITVGGEAIPTTDVTLFNNGEEVAATSVSDHGTFFLDIELQEGENVLTATASTASGTTDPSDPIVVTLDQTKPKLTIGTPADREKTNRETVTVEGMASDENLDWVKVNGQKADLSDDGSYNKRIMLDEGENKIKVVAQDKAGNKRNKTVTVFAKFNAPAIENLEPKEDHYLNAGESVKIEMDSEPGLHPTFVIHMPLTNEKAGVTNATELPMREVGAGHYVGYWTATSSVIAEGAEIEVKVIDDYGKKASKKAEGKLYINVPRE